MANGYRPGGDFAARFRSFSFHFFTPGKPEVVPMGVDHSRLTHGAQAVVGYYAEGLRTAWFTIKPGQHANEDPRSRTDPWMTLMFVVEGGSAKAQIGQETIEMNSRSMIFIPPETEHHFWNPGDRAAEVIMVVFGKEA
jgi:mannose-6-phosphate isomerase-like protein (cupin superfamily)